MDNLTRQICVLGATGSVGRATLNVIAAHPTHYRVRALVAGADVQELAALCRTHRPALAVVADPTRAADLTTALAAAGITDTTIAAGADAVNQAAADPGSDTVVAAISGAAGVEPVLAAARAGKRLLLANKEALIVAGELLPAAVAAGGGELLPVDSEHCALHELLQHDPHYKTLWLTASGGAVRDLPLQDLPNVTPAQALAHPNWSMGKKITIDSATMMNKTLEIIEAAALFNAAPAQIGVVQHPQSTCHALVEYRDGTLVANWSRPDMRLPIARMLAWPQRTENIVEPLDWRALTAATFTEPDTSRYPCLPLAYHALQIGGGAPAALSAANEVAVHRYLAGDIKFTDIARINSGIIDQLHGRGATATSIEEIWHHDKTARHYAAQPV